jgi:pimeloyl-ACP methyl ester carboxylesterase
VTALPDSDEFVQLSEGVCHYCFEGPRDGPTLLLIHGATVPAWEFERIVPMLSAAGFRTLRADLYGHGYSDRPAGPYTQERFVRQMIELLDALELTNPLHVLGHSLGAAVAARMVARQPERVSKLVLAAPLVDYHGTMSAAKLLKVPLVGEALTSGYIVPMLVRRRRRRYRQLDDGRFTHRFETQLIKRGFGRALLSMFRTDALGDQRDCYRALAELPHEILLLRGSHDDILPAEQLEVVRELLPKAGYAEIPETPHSFILSHPEVVAPVLIDFLGDEAEGPRASGVV